MALSSSAKQSLRVLVGEGFRCPKCNSKEHYRYRRGNIKIFQCRGCHTQTTLTEGTIFHSTKLPLTIWFQAMYLLTQNRNNVSTLELRRLIGVSYQSHNSIQLKPLQYCSV
ncbi:transposase-like zinc ribbon protein [Geobacter argillaceus]|uniref:Transposase-like zinc ribbon protein n=1 Tax=Geobacter argillaceus TaxID=345631 RepID=A0A562VGY0_9BACT|nr:transposase-like zinc ribbon protein [Geobacter argillaceus]